MGACSYARGGRPRAYYGEQTRNMTSMDLSASIFGAAGGVATLAPEFLYRFRPLKRLLQYGELEKQEIYFASPSELNDPMEGFRDLFWRGIGSCGRTCSSTICGA